jgi:hypothetical protein
MNELSSGGNRPDLWERIQQIMLAIIVLSDELAMVADALRHILH